MTVVEFYKKNENFIGYKAFGHSEYSDFGSDIVCSSISTALQLPLITMIKVLKIEPFFSQKDGFLEVNLKENEDDKILSQCSLLIEGALTLLEELKKQYPKNIKLVVKEEK